MKFIDTSSQHDSLYHYTTFLLGKSVTDTTSFPPSDWTRSAIVYYRKAAYYIWKNTSGWEFDDSAYTSDLPIATTTLVDQQQNYSIPTNALDIERVEVKGSDGTYVLLSRKNKEEITHHAMTQFYGTPGFPKYYDILGNSIFLYPAPAASVVTLVSGLKVYLARDISAPTIPTSYQSVATSPGFHIDFHPYISVGCALDYGVRSNYVKEKMDNLKALYTEYQTNMEYYYSQRDRAYPTKLRPARRSSI